MRRLTVSIALSLLFNMANPIAHSDNCDGDTCIEVVATEGNQLVLKVRKGKAGSEEASSPRPKPTSAPKRKPWIPWWPLKEQSGVAKPRPTIAKRATSGPRVRPKVKKIPGFSLSDEVKQMLPSGTIITQPASAILVREPVNFMTTVPKSFQTVIIVLDVPIQVNLQAHYRWDFGDDSTIETSLPGAPYPATLITNTYQSAGKYQVKLEVRWSGTWRAGVISGPISGSMRAQFDREFIVRAADTRLNQ